MLISHQHQSLEQPLPLSSLWFPFATQQIWVRHPTSCAEGGVSWGAGSSWYAYCEASGKLIIRFDHVTAILHSLPSKDTTKQHLATSITVKKLTQAKENCRSILLKVSCQIPHRIKNDIQCHWLHLRLLSKGWKYSPIKHAQPQTH